MSDTFLGKNYLNFFTSIFEDKEDKEEKNRLFEQNMQRNLSLLNESNMDNLRTAYTNDPTFNTPNFDPSTITVTGLTSTKPKFVDVTDNIYQFNRGEGDTLYKIGPGGQYEKTNVTPDNLIDINRMLDTENKRSNYRGSNTRYILNDTAGKEGDELVMALRGQAFTPELDQQIKEAEGLLNNNNDNFFSEQQIENIRNAYNIPATANQGVAKPVMGASSINSILPFLMLAGRNNMPKVAPMSAPVVNTGLLSQREKDLYSMFRS